jgi:hypothetical protein
MLPNEWLEYVEAQKKLLKRPPATPKRRMPRITRNESPRMRIVNKQTPNLTRAMYTPENRWNQTPVLPDDSVTTREVGPNDQYNPPGGYRAGKATTEPTQSNKTSRKGARAHGGGSNGKVDWSAIAARFAKGL